MRQIIPHLWFPENAEEACRFYVSILPNSRIDHVSTMPADTPSGPEGAVQVVEFTLLGQPYMAIAAGPLDPFNHAISFLVPCETQEEIDRLWTELVAGGGAYEECGWLRDRYGVAWQITPAKLEEWMRDPDRARARRVAEAMLKMKKLDIAALERAYEGKAAA